MSLIAVIDVETTGLNPYLHHRVVEIAALLVRCDGVIVRHFVSLINSQRDIGPTGKHGIETQDILAAPRFSQIAGTLLETIDGSVALAGHNVRFDHSFLTAEFHRMGHRIPQLPILCTMQLAGGGTLVRACTHHGIPFQDVAHCASDDALATAILLATLLKSAPNLVSEISSWEPIRWPKIRTGSRVAVTRDALRRSQTETPTYLQKLLGRLESGRAERTDNSAILSNTEILDRVLEDRHVDEDEAGCLFDLAERWGITAQLIRNIHVDYLRRLATAALADGVVTDAERRDLNKVAELLGIDRATVSRTLESAAREQPKIPSSAPAAVSQSPPELMGKYVCFTGESRCRLNGQPITREVAREIASLHGLSFVESVTKKLDILVVADPLTQSGKAKRARQYGIRIMDESVFWRELGVKVE